MIQNSNGPEIGDSYSFMPAAFTDRDGGEPRHPEAHAENTVTGRVIQIHSDHRWFRVEYDGGRSGILHECFKF